MIRICPKCGALLLDDTESCSFCDVSAEKDEARRVRPEWVRGTLEPVAANALASRDAAARESSENNEMDWRVEVSRRLDEYRVRRGRVRPDDSQSGLPFAEGPAATELDDEAREHHLALPALRRQGAEGPALTKEGSSAEESPRPALRQRQAAPKTERVDICIQPELDFSSAPDDRAHPQTALVPVASLAQRRWAGALDALFLGLTCAAFVGLFRSLGGQIALEKMDAIVCAAVAYLFYGLYISLFTMLAGATPGMQLRGLTVVRLDGSLPDTRQLLWRSFGYLLSAAPLMLGFLWALWDEDRFTWQDRISQTYITAAAPLSAFDSLNLRAHSH